MNKTRQPYQSGFAPIALVILLLFGIAAGTLLIQNQTNFLPKADETTTAYCSSGGTTIIYLEGGAYAGQYECPKNTVCVDATATCEEVASSNDSDSSYCSQSGTAIVHTRNGVVVRYEDCNQGFECVNAGFNGYCENVDTPNLAYTYVCNGKSALVYQGTKFIEEQTCPGETECVMGQNGAYCDILDTPNLSYTYVCNGKSALVYQGTKFIEEQTCPGETECVMGQNGAYCDILDTPNGGTPVSPPTPVQPTAQGVRAPAAAPQVTSRTPATTATEAVAGAGCDGTHSVWGDWVGQTVQKTGANFKDYGEIPGQCGAGTPTAAAPGAAAAPPVDCGSDSLGLKIPCYIIGTFTTRESLESTKAGATLASQRYDQFKGIIDKASGQINQAILDAAQAKLAAAKAAADACLAGG